MSVSPNRMNYPLSRQKADQDADPYSPAIVEDLLNSLNEWRSVQDVVRLTLKAITDVVKAQGTAIKDMERQLPTKATKTELNSGLALKANVADVQRSLNDLAVGLEGKVSLEDVNTLLEDKVSQGDLQYALNSKASYEETRKLLDAKVELREFESELHAVNINIEDWKREISDRVRSTQIQSSASQRDLQRLTEALETKASRDEVNEGLQDKANKQSVANALHRKANRADVDNLLARKAEVADLQGFLDALKTKADVSVIEKLSQSLGSKAEKLEVAQQLHQETGKLAGKLEVEALSVSLAGIRKEMDQRTQHHSSELRTYSSAWQTELEKTQSTLNLALSKKVDTRDFEQLVSVCGKKPDFDQITVMISEQKTELHEAFQSLTVEAQQSEERMKGKTLETQGRMESEYRRLEEELGRVKETLRNTAERHKDELEDTLKYANTANTSLKSDLFSEVKLLKTALEQQLEAFNKTKADARELHDVKTGLTSAIETRALAAELSSFRTSQNKEIAASLTQMQQDLASALNRHQKEVEEQLQDKPNITELEAVLQEKIDFAALTAAVNTRATVEDFDLLRDQIEQVKSGLRQRAEVVDLESHIKYTREALEEVGKDILLKGNIKDVCSLLDMKANIDDVNKALEELHQGIEGKLVSEEFRTHVADQALINEALCAENCVGRWIWKSGEVRTGLAIPWEVQSVNTCPDNFIWEKDKTSVLTVAPGLYEVMMGFFSRKRPVIQLLINGESVLSEGGTN